MSGHVDERLERYATLLYDENARTNLVSRRLTRSDISELVRTFAATLERVGLNAHGWLLDIGSGGGLPGIPLAIRHPSLTVTLNESRRLRVLALETFVEELGLENCEILAGRIERYAIDADDGADIVTAFGVGKAVDVIPVATQFLCTGGSAIISIPANPTETERARWLLTAATQECRADVHERVLGGDRSVLVVTRTGS